MKTTESPAPRVVKRTALATAASGLAVVAVAGAVAGSAAASGAAVGGVITVGVFAFGAFAVEAVARLMPSASLMFALVTYTLQVAALALVFVALTGSGVLDEQVDRNWLAGSIVVGTHVWMAVQIRLAMTARIPAFETGGEQSVNDRLEGPRPAAEGGAR